MSASVSQGNFQEPEANRPELLVVCLHLAEERPLGLYELPKYFKHAGMKSCKEPGPLNCR